MRRTGLLNDMLVTPVSVFMDQSSVVAGGLDRRSADRPQILML
jgi:hypothetical protein